MIKFNEMIMLLLLSTLSFEVHHYKKDIFNKFMGYFWALCFIAETVKFVITLKG